MFAGFLFASFILLGIAGIFLSVYGEYITYSNIPFYVQGVNTILSVFLSLAETGLLVSTIKWVEVMKHEQENLRRSYNLPNLSNNNEFTYCHIVFLGIAMLGMNIGLIIMFWSLTIAYSYSHHSFLEGTIWPFFLIDGCLALVTPILMAMSFVPLVIVVRYTTNNQIETRHLYHWCLPFMSYEQGNKGSYWTINDTFYYKIEEKLCGGLNSVLLYLLAVSVFMNSWFYFINIAFIDQFGIQNCNMLTERGKPYTYCFDLFSNVGRALFINCSFNSTYDEPMYCFRIKQIGVDTDPVQILVACSVLYYISTFCISVIFQVVKGLLHYTATQAWSNVVMLIGIFVWLLGIASLASVYYIHTNLDILSGLQLSTIGFIILIVSFLLKRGNPLFAGKAESIGTSAITPLNPSEFSMHEHIEMIPRTISQGDPAEVEEGTSHMSIPVIREAEQQSENNPIPSPPIQIEPQTNRYASQINIQAYSSSQTLPLATSPFHQPTDHIPKSQSGTITGIRSQHVINDGFATISNRKVTIL
jgi:hypothetical protein